MILTLYCDGDAVEGFASGGTVAMASSMSPLRMMGNSVSPYA